MLNPQEVRKRRQEAMRQCQIQRQSELMEESKKVFQWILTLIDKATTKGFLGSIAVWQFDDSNCINAGGENYDKCSFPRDEIFPIICEVINAEDGYHAEYKKNVVYYDENAWDITVTVE